MARATASLENSSICEKLNSSETSMRLLGGAINNEEKYTSKSRVAYSLTEWILGFEFWNALSMVKVAGYPAFPQDAWSLQA